MSSLRKANIKKSSIAAGRRISEPNSTPEERWKMIAEAAFFRAEHRNFKPGFEELDWFEAEKEIENRLANQ